MIELGTVTKQIVDECAMLIQDIWTKNMAKYDSSLGKRSLLNTFATGYKKLEWLIREKDKVLKLQEKLKANTSRLSLLIAAAAQWVL
jgi:hypothetical protein